jgi:hypothetical protein
MPTAEGSGSGSFSRKIEFAANIATFVVAVLLSVVLVKAYFLPASSPRTNLRARATNFLTVGASLAKRLPDIDWSRNRQTLVLALSTQCHYCTESAPFFRQIREKVGNNVKILAVLPQPVAESEAYLNREGVRMDGVKQASLEQIGVTGTPTMLLLIAKEL